MIKKGTITKVCCYLDLDEHTHVDITVLCSDGKEEIFEGSATTYRHLLSDNAFSAFFKSLYNSKSYKRLEGTKVELYYDKYGYREIKNR